MKIYKTLGVVWTGVALAFASTPAVVNDMDVLGQFLEQNFPVQNDPLKAFALSYADQVGVRAALTGPLLSSRSASVFNNKTGKVLYQKNPDRVMSTASTSKLMSAVVVLDAHLDMNEPITITEAEVDRLKGTGSRLGTGTTLTRGELLCLSLMDSENRATHALSRTYPGGMNVLAAAMNAKAQSLGMSSSRFYEPTGLSFQNVSTARDLGRMVAVASKYPLIRKNSTSNYGLAQTANGRQNYRNSNALVREGSWNIELQRTGYIREARRSMVVKANTQNQPTTIILLNSPSSATHVSDACETESWMLQRRS